MASTTKNATCDAVSGCSPSRIAAQTTELHSPADVYVTVRDGGSSELAHTDPQRDAFIDFTAPADGDFFIVAEHLNYAFGPSEVYRLTVTPPTPAVPPDPQT